MSEGRSTSRVLLFVASIFARLYAFYMGGIFIFGQLFAGHFSVGATVAGLFGMLAALLPLFKTPRAQRAAAAVCFTCIGGVAADAYDYYAHLAIPGNYYAWFLIGPFAMAVALLGVRHLDSLRNASRA